MTLKVRRSTSPPGSWRQQRGAERADSSCCCWRRFAEHEWMPASVRFAQNGALRVAAVIPCLIASAAEAARKLPRLPCCGQLLHICTWAQPAALDQQRAAAAAQAPARIRQSSASMLRKTVMQAACFAASDCRVMMITLLGE
jgi:hypothetical protein